MKKHLLKTVALCVLMTPVFIAGCEYTAEYREVTAERIARPAFMAERKFQSNGMDVQLWERMHQRQAPANVYIEGDGWDSREKFDPTPVNPVALQLASRDLEQNVAYIGRPCQFRESQDEDKCSSTFWTNRRFSPEVLQTYNQALDQMKVLYNITEFNLIGYDGGANIAAVLASQRNDVVSLRTVAGNLVPDIVYAERKQSLDADSLKASDIASSLATMPQHHFVGAGDTVVGARVYHSFVQSMGKSDCVHYTFVQDADHERGWVEKWPQLLKATTKCVAPPTPVALPPVMIDTDVSNGMK